MKLDDGILGLSTVMGLFFSLLLMIIFLLYTAIKLDTLITRKDVDILSTVNHSVYGPDFIFNASQGLNFAVAFTAYDNEEYSILDPSIGELVMKAWTWGETDYDI